MKVTVQLERAELARYGRIFAAVPEVNVIANAKAQVIVNGQHRPLLVLPRPPSGSDPGVVARRLADTVPGRAVGLVAARSIPYAERDALEAAGLSWCDGRGALHLRWPGTLVHIDHGARRFATRESPGTDETRLGPAGIRAVQVLLASPQEEWTVNRLAERAEISVGQAHNVFRAMEQKRLVYTAGKGPKQRRVIDDRRAALDWLAVVDGARRRPPAAATYLYARTETELARRFAERAVEVGVAYAVTGAAGSSLLGVPVLSRIVVTQIRVGGLQPIEALGRLGLEHPEADQAGRGVNLALWADIGEVGTFGAPEVDGVRVAPPIRVWLDLRRQGGRNVDAAQLFREQALEQA
ncbi:MAG: hypothetical protein ACYCO3_01215 [Mycobacteriales bacterium]